MFRMIRRKLIWLVPVVFVLSGALWLLLPLFITVSTTSHFYDDGVELTAEDLAAPTTGACIDLCERKLLAVGPKYRPLVLEIERVRKVDPGTIAWLTDCQGVEVRSGKKRAVDPVERARRLSLPEWGDRLDTVVHESVHNIPDFALRTNRYVMLRELGWRWFGLSKYRLYFETLGAVGWDA
jgi:hypothetical protein